MNHPAQTLQTKKDIELWCAYSKPTLLHSCFARYDFNHWRQAQLGDCWTRLDWIDIDDSLKDNCMAIRLTLLAHEQNYELMRRTKTSSRVCEIQRDVLNTQSFPLRIKCLFAAPLHCNWAGGPQPNSESGNLILRTTHSVRRSAGSPMPTLCLPAVERAQRRRLRAQAARTEPTLRGVRRL